MRKKTVILILLSSAAGASIAEGVDKLKDMTAHQKLDMILENQVQMMEALGGPHIHPPEDNGEW